MVLLLGLSLHGLAALSFLPRLTRKLFNKGGARPLKVIKLKRGNRYSRKPVPADSMEHDLETFTADSVAQQHLDLNLRVRSAIKTASLRGLPGFGPASVAEFKTSSDFESTYVFPPSVQPSDIKIPVNLVPSRERDSFLTVAADEASAASSSDGVDYAIRNLDCSKIDRIMYRASVQYATQEKPRYDRLSAIKSEGNSGVSSLFTDSLWQRHLSH